METCKTCKYWNVWGESSLLSQPCDRATRIFAGDGQTDIRLGHREMAVIVGDFGNLGGYATLATSPDFGCIHHDPKKE